VRYPHLSRRTSGAPNCRKSIPGSTLPQNGGAPCLESSFSRLVWRSRCSPPAYAADPQIFETEEAQEPSANRVASYGSTRARKFTRSRVAVLRQDRKEFADKVGFRASKGTEGTIRTLHVLSQIFHGVMTILKFMFNFIESMSPLFQVRTPALLHTAQTHRQESEFG
jgi:hypothetical protein